MEIISFGEYIEGKKFKVLDEREMRASAGIMLFLGLIALINSYFWYNYWVVCFVSGFLMLNFLIGIFINPKFAPTLLFASLIVRKQSALPIGAVQKKFAWSLGLILSTAIFILSLFLLKNSSFFPPVCQLCLVCITLLYLESAFGICMGCKLYKLFLKLKFLPAPVEKPNCMGDSCQVNV